MPDLVFLLPTAVAIGLVAAVYASTRPASYRWTHRIAWLVVEIRDGYILADPQRWWVDHRTDRRGQWRHDSLSGDQILETLPLPPHGPIPVTGRRYVRHPTLSHTDNTTWEPLSP